MIKAIFFDIDGTLLSHTTAQVPDSTKKALELLHKNHILTIVASGRHICELENLPLQDLHFDAYVTTNGQYCYSADEVIYKNPIAREDVCALLAEVDREPFPCLFLEEKQQYINYHSLVVEEVQASIHTDLPPLGDLKRGYKQDIYQMIPYIPQDREESLLASMPHVKMIRWHPNVVDLIPENGGKHIGIQKVCEYYGLKKEETMAFGDAYNDLSMFGEVGTSIAMGNGIDEIKEIADYVTDSVDEDGIYRALKHFELI